MNNRDMGIKDELNKGLRTIRARDYVFTVDQMASYRIKGVYNASASVEEMTDAYIQWFAHSVHRADKGEVAIIETSIKSGGFDVLNPSVVQNPLQIVSVLVFADYESWHMYALRNLEIYYQPGHNLHTLLN